MNAPLLVACRHQDHPAGAPFRVLDEGATRGDLASRREVKFTVRGADVETLRRLLEGNCRRLIHHDRVSTVRSVYFDDVRLSACRANLDGIGRRQKVRLRWYDAPLPGEEFFFEVKWRDNRVTGKHRLHLRTTRPLAGMTYSQIVEGLLAVLPPARAGDLLRSCEPIVIVQYRREHFASRDLPVRVTLDYDLAFYDQTGKQAIWASFPRRLDGLAVVEGKAPVGHESELRRLLFPWTPRTAPCSKYVHGCRLLGLIPHGL